MILSDQALRSRRDSFRDQTLLILNQVAAVLAEYNPTVLALESGCVIKIGEHWVSGAVQHGMLFTKQLHVVFADRADGVAADQRRYELHEIAAMAAYVRRLLCPGP